MGNVLQTPKNVAKYDESDYKNLTERDNSNEGLPLVDQDEPDGRVVMHRRGTVTALYKDHGCLDGKYMYWNVVKTLNIGDKVSYTVYKLNEREDWRVTNVERIAHVHNDDDVPNISSVNLSTSKADAQNIIGAVKKIQDGILMISPPDREFRLNKTSLTFSPVKGDWVSVEVVVKVGDEEKEVIDVIAVKPLRYKVRGGRVTHYDAEINSGIVDNEVFFSQDVCQPGYVPVVGDKVTIMTVESNQGQLTWRATHVVSNEGAKRKITTPPATQCDTPKNAKVRRSVQISASSPNSVVSAIGDSVTYKVFVENGGYETRTITSVEVQTERSPNNVIVGEITFPFKLAPQTSLEFAVTITTGHIGNFVEKIAVCFEDGFQIYSLLTVVVKCPEMEREPQVKSGRRSRFVVRKYATKTGFVIPGIKPVRPLPYVSKRLYSFPLPDDLVRAVVGDGSVELCMEQVLENVQEVCPSVLYPLTYENYENKFSTLLFLEEIEAGINITSLDRDGVYFRRSADCNYYVMEIPGLLELRPTLTVGDQLVASSPSVGEYGAYVHKVLSDEVWLKFPQDFDINDGDEFSVNFSINRTGYRRKHQAIRIARGNSHLGEDWLFPPDNVPLKTPCIDIVCDLPPIPKNKKCDICPPVDFVPQDHSSQNPGPSETSRVQESSKSLSSEFSGNELRTDRSSESSRNGFSGFGESSVRNGSWNESSINTEADDEGELTVEESPTTYGFYGNQSSSLRSYGESPNRSNYSYQSKSNAVHTAQGSWKNSGRNYGKNMRNSGSKYGFGSSKSKNDKKWTEGRRIDEMETSKILKLVNTDLNQCQREAVKNILRAKCRPLPYIVFGPPGTGKTVTLVEAIIQIYTLFSESRLLIATSSNSAADLLCERLLMSELFDVGNLLRLVGFNYYASSISRTSSIIKEFSAVLDLERTGDEIRVADDRITKIGNGAIGRHRITISTCSTIGNLFGMNFPEDHFTHLIIDEAAQCSEPEILIPLAFLSKNYGQVIMAGDPKQLGSVILSQISKYAGLRTSLMERFLDKKPYVKDKRAFPKTNGYDPSFVTELLYNYRSVPPILNLYSSMFYDNDLIPQICIHSALNYEAFSKLKDHLPGYLGKDIGSLIFHGVEGTDSQIEDSYSFYNTQEAAIVAHYVGRLAMSGFNQEDIGIVTPYYQQIIEIRNMLKAFKLRIPKVGTVEEFQGQERQIIIASMVRTKKHSGGKSSTIFIGDEQRVNVMLSRARGLLLLIGNPETLVEIPTWRIILKHCVDRNCYVGCKLPSVFRK